MASVPLHEFIAVHRDAVIARCRAKAATRSTPLPPDAAADHGVPLFLDQLIHALLFRSGSSTEIGTSASMHGHDRLVQGCTIAQVVTDYGDVCQSIGDLAVEMDTSISMDDYRRLTGCVDEAVVAAVTEFGAERNQSTLDGASVTAAERHGIFAHEVGDLAQTAMLAFDVLKTGSVGTTGSTAAVLNRSLLGLRRLVSCSFADVRLTKNLLHRERFLASEFIADLEPAARLEAKARDLTLAVPRVTEGLVILADRQVLGAVVGNLLQNAFKFTRPHTTVTLQVQGSAERVLIEVLDECGGLPEGNINDLFRAFEQRNADRTGLGLGLAFSRRGVEANDGRIYAHNLPHHQGCAFSIDLPRLPTSSVAMM